MTNLKRLESRESLVDSHLSSAHQELEKIWEEQDWKLRAATWQEYCHDRGWPEKLRTILSLAERREYVAKLADSGMSQRAIADVVGVSQMQVRRDLRNADVRPHVSPAESERKVTGRDGKTYNYPNRPQVSLADAKAIEASKHQAQDEHSATKTVAKAATMYGNAAELVRLFQDLSYKDGKVVDKIRMYSNQVRFLLDALDDLLDTNVDEGIAEILRGA